MMRLAGRLPISMAHWFAHVNDVTGVCHWPLHYLMTMPLIIRFAQTLNLVAAEPSPDSRATTKGFRRMTVVAHC